MSEHDDPYGRLMEIDGELVVRFTRQYDVARTEVWSALTDPDRLARWMFRATFEPRGGGSLQFHLGDETEEGTVLAWDEPSLLEYEWGAHREGSWRVRFTLTEDGEGTLLTFDHILPAPRNPEYAAGWHWHLDRLSTHLSGARPADVDSDEHFDNLLEHYSDAAGHGRHD